MRSKAWRDPKQEAKEGILLTWELVLQKMQFVSFRPETYIIKTIQFWIIW